MYYGSINYLSDLESEKKGQDLKTETKKQINVLVPIKLKKKKQISGIWH